MMNLNFEDRFTKNHSVHGRTTLRGTVTNKPVLLVIQSL